MIRRALRTLTLIAVALVLLISPALAFAQIEDCWDCEVFSKFRANRSSTDVMVSDGPDLRDNRAYVGSMHNIFVVKIEKIVEQGMRLGFPNVIYEAKVIYNIKGELEGQIILSQADYTEGVPVKHLEVGSTYLVGTRHIPSISPEYFFSDEARPSVLISNDSSLTEQKIVELSRTNTHVKDLLEAYPVEILPNPDIQKGYIYNSFKELDDKKKGTIFKEIAALNKLIIKRAPEPTSHCIDCFVPSAQTSVVQEATSTIATSSSTVEKFKFRISRNPILLKIRDKIVTNPMYLKMQDVASSLILSVMFAGEGDYDRAVNNISPKLTYKSSPKSSPQSLIRESELKNNVSGIYSYKCDDNREFKMAVSGDLKSALFIPDVGSSPSVLIHLVSNESPQYSGGALLFVPQKRDAQLKVGGFTVQCAQNDQNLTFPIRSTTTGKVIAPYPTNEYLTGREVFRKVMEETNRLCGPSDLFRIVDLWVNAESHQFWHYFKNDKCGTFKMIYYNAKDSVAGPERVDANSPVWNGKKIEVADIGVFSDDVLHITGRKSSPHTRTYLVNSDNGFIWQVDIMGDDIVHIKFDPKTGRYSGLPEQQKLK